MESQNLQENSRSIALRDTNIIDTFFEEFSDRDEKIEELEKEADLDEEEKRQIVRLLTFNFPDEAIVNNITEHRDGNKKTSELFSLVKSYRSHYDDIVTIIRNKFEANASKLFRFGSPLNRIHLLNNIAELYVKQLDNYDIGSKEFDGTLKIVLSLMKELRTETNLTKSHAPQELDDVIGGGANMWTRKRVKKNKKVGEKIYTTLKDKYGKEVVDAAYEAMEREKVEVNEQNNN